MDANVFINEATGLRSSGDSADQNLSAINGWDSLAMVNLVVALEDKIERELEAEELENLMTAGDVAKILATLQ